MPLSQVDKGRSALWPRLVVAVGGILGVLYFVAAALHVGPLNPISARYGNAVRAVLAPYFDQRWSLFAPDPIADESALLARVRCADGHTSGFVDVTTRYIAQVQHDRFFPPRASRLVSNGMLVAGGNDPLAQRLRDAHAKDRRDGAARESTPAELTLTPEERRLQEAGLTLLTRYSVLEAGSECSSSRVTEVQLRFVHHAFPGWSERKRWREVGSISTQDIGWRTV
jgi:hypothetical protein